MPTDAGFFLRVGVFFFSLGRPLFHLSLALRALGSFPPCASFFFFFFSVSLRFRGPWVFASISLFLSRRIRFALSFSSSRFSPFFSLSGLGWFSPSFFSFPDFFGVGVGGISGPSSSPLWGCRFPCFSSPFFFLSRGFPSPLDLLVSWGLSVPLVVAASLVGGDSASRGSVRTASAAPRCEAPSKKNYFRKRLCPPGFRK